MKTLKPIREITDHPRSNKWQTFYECPSTSHADESYIVATNESDDWGCSCPRWKFHREECKHIRAVRLFLIFAEEREEEITPVSLNDLPQKSQKAVSRFSLVEVS